MEIRDASLGMGVTARHVESLVAETALALEVGATAMDLALTIHPHPTLSEARGEAAAILLGLPSHPTAPSGSGSDPAPWKGRNREADEGGNEEGKEEG